MLQWLSFGLVFVRYDLAFNAYLALGRPHYFTAISLTKLVSLLPGPDSVLFVRSRRAILGIACHMAPATFWLLYFNRRRGIQNIRLEVLVLLAWPAGWLAGSGVLYVLDFLKVHLVTD